ncbi:ANTAR domain-containing response regulator [Marinobacterium arenosum]|uniref:ANTAR domain-containing response regulator n=1 Tax=Marinobacterium arenosum TaxID=2862496 RepID=UPI001C95B914|nr:ANTAR domain-containing protein [Marinobacterium arenosum]MBY4678474.1 ANTAR domain-containing protein [Marinobacterium arenosum]
MPLDVLLIDTEPGRIRTLTDALHALGHRVVATLPNAETLSTHVQQLQPDIVIIDMDGPDRDTLDSMAAMSRTEPRPIVFFAETGQPADTIGEAIRAGVSAYVSDGVQAERVKPILDTAIAQFNAFNELRLERDQALDKLEERKLIDRAKGLLMKHQNWDEEQAYKTLRKLAMDRGQKLVDVARHVIDALENLLDNAKR